jgi:hypothetical protein
MKNRNQATIPGTIPGSATVPPALPQPTLRVAGGTPTTTVETTALPSEPYPGYHAEIAARTAKDQAYREASANPLPGPLTEAFASLPENVAGLRVRKMVHYDFVLLRIIKSPLLEQLARTRGGKRGLTRWSDDQGWEMIWQFTRPPEVVHAWLSRQPPARAAANYREMCRREIGFTLGPVEGALLVRLVQKAFVEAFSTVLQYIPRDDGSGATTQSFQTPPAGTASAGGHDTSAD